MYVCNYKAPSTQAFPYTHYGRARFISNLQLLSSLLSFLIVIRSSAVTQERRGKKKRGHGQVQSAWDLVYRLNNNHNHHHDREINIKTTQKTTRSQLEAGI